MQTAIFKYIHKKCISKIEKTIEMKGKKLQEKIVLVFLSLAPSLANQDLCWHVRNFQDGFVPLRGANGTRSV